MMAAGWQSVRQDIVAIPIIDQGVGIEEIVLWTFFLSLLCTCSLFLSRYHTITVHLRFAIIPDLHQIDFPQRMMASCQNHGRCNSAAKHRCDRNQTREGESREPADAMA
jgi:hypothetical protein